MSQPIIEVSNLSKRYHLGAIGATSLREEFSRLVDRVQGKPHPDAQEFWALRDVSFEIQPGEVVGVIGRNGAGKSTLLKILSRITEPTSGRATMRGRVASLLEVGTGFHPELTGRENVFLNGAILGMNRYEVRRKFDEIVAFAEVEQFIDTPVKRYSSGMYVRLAFAVAAHLEPEILIIDEVLAVGDANFQRKCLRRIRSLAAEEMRTVLFVSHNLSAVVQLCTRAVYLQKGRLGAIGSPAEIIRDHFNTGHSATQISDLARQPRSAQLGKQALLMSAQIAGAAGDNSWQLAFGSPIKIEFKINVRDRLQRLELGIGLFNLQDVEICSSLSSWSTQHGPIDPGIYRLIAAYPALAILPGTYRFGVGLKSEHDLLDYVPEAFDIQFVDAPHAARPNLATVGGAIAVDITTTLTRLPELT